MGRAGRPQSLARVIMRNFVFPPERPPSQGSESVVIRTATRPPQGRRARSQRLPLSCHTKLTHFLLFLASKTGRLLLGRTTVCAGYKCSVLLEFLVCCFGTGAPCWGAGGGAEGRDLRPIMSTLRSNVFTTTSSTGHHHINHVHIHIHTRTQTYSHIK